MVLEMSLFQYGILMGSEIREIQSSTRSLKYLPDSKSHLYLLLPVFFIWSRIFFKHRKKTTPPGFSDPRTQSYSFLCVLLPLIGQLLVLKLFCRGTTKIRTTHSSFQLFLINYWRIEGMENIHYSRNKRAEYMQFPNSQGSLCRKFI